MKFSNENLIEDVFCKVLTKNDDSGRHGVLIPVYAYHLFPDFVDFRPDKKENYEESIVTYWNESTGWKKKNSKWKHYHRYPERRMTSLSPELLNNKMEGTILVFGKYKEVFEYECHVFSPEDKDYYRVIEKFSLNFLNSQVVGSALLPFEEVIDVPSGKQVFEELMFMIQKVNSKGYIKSSKQGDTAIGFTFEEELGIQSNSNKNPDYKGIEIKCGRSKQVKERRKISKGKQTLFALVPNWGRLSNRRELVEIYGHNDPNRNRKGLYCTIKVTENSYGWKLEIDEIQQKIFLCNNGERVVNYDMSDLKNTLEQKHGETVFITAHSKKDPDGIERFHYDTVVHCREVQFKEFINLIKENQIGVDFAIHKKNDKVRDHGFLWRLDNKKHLLRLFKYVREVM
ncbi:MvaI/BcnI family restriction endonuclease [Alkalicoccus chagannorensis]|uniref:MvaI/BcnI family restriction endonuclease n=1 Tax=Alkalicoccus chagannorensis TaxID=427072 RepID=UPI000419E132|nr:MvaI/BcnI family restriction endonuclease [Alkalicoccus chagannorensis]